MTEDMHIWAQESRDLDYISPEELKNLLFSKEVKSWLWVIEKFTDIPPVFLSHARIAEATIEKNLKNRIAKKIHQIINKRNNSEYDFTEITIIMWSRIIIVPFDIFDKKNRYLISISWRAYATVKWDNLYAINDTHQEIIDAHNDRTNDLDFQPEVNDWTMSDDIMPNIDTIPQPHSEKKIDLDLGLIHFHKMAKFSFTRWKQWRDRKNAKKNPRI